MSRAHFLLALFAISLLSGCSAHRAKWLHGKWVFDSEMTRAKMGESTANQPKPEGLLDGLKETANGLVAPQLVNALEGSQITFTDKDIVMTTADGNGKAFGYEVVEAPDADTLTLKQSDGEVNTYHREGDRFWTTSTGTVKLRVYFRRAK